MKIFQFSRVLACLLVVGGSSARADEVLTGQQLYEPVFRMSGLFMRAAYICADSDSKMFADAATKVQTLTEELKAIGRMYPNFTEKWMKSGAEMMNEKVMNEGLPAACFSAGVLMMKAVSSMTALKEKQKQKPQ